MVKSLEKRGFLSLKSREGTNKTNIYDLSPFAEKALRLCAEGKPVATENTVVQDGIKNKPITLSDAEIDTINNAIDTVVQYGMNDYDTVIIDGVPTVIEYGMAPSYNTDKEENTQNINREAQRATSAPVPIEDENSSTVKTDTTHASVSALVAPPLVNYVELIGGWDTYNRTQLVDAFKACDLDTITYHCEIQLWKHPQDVARALKGVGILNQAQLDKCIAELDYDFPQQPTPVRDTPARYADVEGASQRPTTRPQPTPARIPPRVAPRVYDDIGSAF